MPPAGSSSATTTSWSAASPRSPTARCRHRRRAGQRAHRPARARARSGPSSRANLRNAAHRVADAIYEKIIGVRGAFATRIAYVSVDGKPPSAALRAVSSRMPTARTARVILQSDRPIMSPAWSPDGEWLAYVSFERRVSAVFVQQLRSGKQQHGVGARRHQRRARRVRPTARSWRSRSRAATATSTSIYSISARRQLTRLTDDPGIDTEAVVHARRHGHLLHLGSLRQSADLQARRWAAASGRAASPSPAPTMRARASRPTASSSRC